MKKICVLPGDGIGPEVTNQAVKVLEACEEKFGYLFEYRNALIGASAIHATGDPLPKETMDYCINSNAILLGAVGDPSFDNKPEAKVRPEQGLLKLRKILGVYANIRPIKSYPELRELSPLKTELLRNVDFVIFRELTGGIYFGEKAYIEDQQLAYDTCAYYDYEIERIAKLAFEAAQKGDKQLHLVDKANVLASSRLWRKTVSNLAKQYPEVDLKYLFVDNAAMQLIMNPAQFKVIVTSNMFGDILSDAASVLPGSLGLLPSASIGDSHALFEPVHGSYPSAAGKNIANPIASILSAAMLLDHFEYGEAATSIRNGIDRIMKAGIGTEDLHPEVQIQCDSFGDLVCELIMDPNMVIDPERYRQQFSTII